MDIIRNPKKENLISLIKSFKSGKYKIGYAHLHLRLKRFGSCNFDSNGRGCCYPYVSSCKVFKNYDKEYWYIPTLNGVMIHKIKDEDFLTNLEKELEMW